MTVVDGTCIGSETCDAVSLVNTGDAYFNGRGDAGETDPDFAQAVLMYRRAAEMGDATGQVKLGGCYKKGLGVEKDLAEAARWYRLAADQGDAAGQSKLGTCYFLGEGVEENKTTAVGGFRLAAEQGHLVAQNTLG